MKENMPTLRLLDIMLSGTDISKLLQIFLLQMKMKVKVTQLCPPL